MADSDACSNDDGIENQQDAGDNNLTDNAADRDDTNNLLVETSSTRGVYSANNVDVDDDDDDGNSENENDNTGPGATTTATATTSIAATATATATAATATISPGTASSITSASRSVEHGSQDDTYVGRHPIETKSDSDEPTARATVEFDIPITNNNLQDDGSKDATATQQDVSQQDDNVDVVESTAATSTTAATTTITTTTTTTTTNGFPSRETSSPAEIKSAGSKKPYFFEPTKRLLWSLYARLVEVSSNNNEDQQVEVSNIAVQDSSSNSKTPPHFFDPSQRLPPSLAGPGPGPTGTITSSNTSLPGAYWNPTPLEVETIPRNNPQEQDLQQQQQQQQQQQPSASGDEESQNISTYDSFPTETLIEAEQITLGEPAEEVPHPDSRRRWNNMRASNSRCRFLLIIIIALGFGALILAVRVAVGLRANNYAGSPPGLNETTTPEELPSPQQFLLQFLPNYTVEAIDLDYIDQYFYNMQESSNSSSSNNSNSNTTNALSSAPFSFDHLYNLSPQTKAFLWTIRDPDFDEYRHHEWRVVQRFALACLYYATGGDSWHNNFNWLSYDVDEGQWYFHTIYANVRHDLWVEDMSVYLLAYLLRKEGEGLGHLWLSDNGLDGTIPPELSLLTSLRTLDLQGNSLVGTLPSQIGTLGRLEAVSFSMNQLTGMVPSEIGQLQSLLALDISRNQFSGEIPSEVGMLQTWVLLAGINNFSNMIPTQLGLMTHLLALRLQKNSLSGEMPTELGQLTALQYLDLSLNQLTGSLPTELGNLLQDPLGFIDIYGNIIGEKIGMSHLTSVARQYGSEAFRNGTATIGLKFGGNLITGSIPTELGLLFEPENLSFWGNLLSGSIISELGRLSQLKYLSLQDNRFYGSIPSHLGRLTDLKWISFEGNDLVTGLVPDDLCFLQSSYLLFDCSPTLCGCDCVCPSNTSKQQHLTH